MLLNKITTVLLLAAGTGSRLRPLTIDAPKCLTLVGGKPILGRLLDNLRRQGITRLVVVTGYLGNQIREFLQRNAGDIQVDYVFNPYYRTTNNIYSLWLAKQQIDEPFLLIESDLVFDGSMLADMLYPGKIAISKILPWMNGTTVELDAENGVSSFHAGYGGKHLPRYKTVNIYSLSLQSWKKVIKRLNLHVSGAKLGGYYEVVFANMVADRALAFEAVFFAEDRWYEIDTLRDLHQADRMYDSRRAPPLRVPRLGFGSSPTPWRTIQHKEEIQVT